MLVYYYCCPFLPVRYRRACIRLSLYNMPKYVHKNTLVFALLISLAKRVLPYCKLGMVSHMQPEPLVIGHYHLQYKYPHSKGLAQFTDLNFTSVTSCR